MKIKQRKPAPSAGWAKGKEKGKSKDRKQFPPMQASTDTEAESTDAQQSQFESMDPDSEVESIMNEVLQQPQTRKRGRQSRRHTPSEVGSTRRSPEGMKDHRWNLQGGHP